MLSTGEIAFERFEIERAAGEGGMGVVYRARDLTTGETVALKVLGGLVKHGVARFEREAVMLADVTHPGIVRYVAHGPSWIAMEWLEGEDLEQRLLREHPTLGESIAIVRGAAEALDAAHARGIVHRDIKPANLWLDGGDPSRVKVLDFGMARVMVQAALTAAGTVVGTPAYMAPEQARGAGELDARADVFSLGCVFFECIARRPAFVGESIAAVLAKVLLEDVPPLSTFANVPRRIDDLVARMLSKDPAARPADAGAIVTALARLEVTSTLAPSRSLSKVEQRIASVVLVSRANLTLRTMVSSNVTQVDVVDGGALAAYKTIAEHGGRTETLADGSFVVALDGGAPMDQARRAATCALALEVSLNARIALATGRALAGSRPVGDALDRAARLLRATPPARGLRIDAATAGLLDTSFEIEADAEGLSLVALRPRREEVRTVLGKPTPCVGREADLAMLESVLARAIDDERAAVAIVTAPPGVGKTRLAQEFTQRLGDRAAAWIGRGDPMTANAPFGFCARMVQAEAGLQAGEPLASRKERLRARVRRHLSNDETAERVAAFLGEMCGTSFSEHPLVAAARHDPVVMGDHIRQAWVDFVEAECSASPLLLVLDDMQWADRGALDAIDLALGVCRDRPLLVLALARPEVDEVHAGLLAMRAPTRIQLRPLPRKHAERLVRAVLGEAATDVVTRIVDSADGNPFSLEELTRAAATGASEIPDSVLALIEARLAKLDAESRRVLRAASVFGQTFFRGAVAELVGETATRVSNLLDALVQGEWITQLGHSSVRGDVEYRFRHALVRDATYAMLTEDDRNLAHALAAEWLERTGATDAATLAEHYERGGLLPRAAETWARAVALALEGNAFEQVIAFARHAEQCGAEGPTLGRVLLAESDAYNWRGDHAKVLPLATRAVTQLGVGTATWAEAMVRLTLASWKLGEHERGLDYARTLAATADHCDPSAYGQLARLAGIMFMYGPRDTAESLLLRIEAACPEPDDALEAALLDAHARSALVAGDLGVYVAYQTRSAAAHDRAGHMRMGCLTRVNLAFALDELGDHDEAERRLRSALSETERIGLPGARASALHMLGIVLVRQGRIDEGVQAQAEALETFTRHGDRRMESACHEAAAVAALAKGDVDEAERHAARAVELTTTAPPRRAYSLAISAAVRDRRGDSSALQQAREAMTCLDAHGAEESEGYIRLVCAEIEHARGDRTLAKAFLQKASAQLLERAAKISVPSWRVSFLERVAEHARTLRLAREL